MSSTVTVPQMELSVILDEIEERANKATEGPWRADETSVGFAVAIRPGQTGYLLASMGRDNMLYREGKRNVIDDADFIASARTDVPALVKALRHACERIGHFSDLYCGVNDMTGRNALEEISTILNQGRSQ